MSDPINDPRDAIHQDSRPLDRFFYDRDQSGESWEGFDPDEVVLDGENVVVSWTNPGGKYFKFRVKRDGEFIHGASPLEADTTSFVDIGATDTTAKYRIQGRQLIPGGNEQLEYDRHRAMFWELYANYWNDRYATEYARYYDSEEKTVPGSNARSQSWHPASEEYPGYGTPVDEDCPYTDVAPGGPVSTYSDLPADVIGERPGWIDPKILGPKVKEALTETEFTRNHVRFDRSQEAFGAARGCYEVWTDVFVDITDGFRGGYQYGDMRWIFRTPLNEEFVYTENIIQEMYGMNGQFNWSTVVGTKELPVDGMGENAWADSSASNHYYAWDQSDETPADLKDSGYDDHFGIVIHDETRVAGLVPYDSADPLARNRIKSSTKVDNWLQEEWIKGTTPGEDGDDGEIHSVTKYCNSEFMKETIKPGKLAGENGQVWSSIYGLEDTYHGGRVNEVFVGGQASFALDARVSLEIALALESYIGGIVEIFGGLKTELALAASFGLRMGPALDIGLGQQVEVALHKTETHAKNTKVWGLANYIAGGIGTISGNDTTISSGETSVSAFHVWS